MKRLWFAALLICMSTIAFAQQDYVGRYEGYAAVSHLSSPDLNLGQWGFNTQVGVNVRRWLALGFDYSVQVGSTNLVPSELNNATLLKLSALGPLPPGYNLYVPYDSTTQSFTAGPQFEYRHFKRITLFAHPLLGAIREDITLKAHDAVTTGLLTALPELGIAPGPKLSDTTYFYGVGGGADYNVAKHVHIKCDMEYVHTFLFSDLLASPRNAFRISVGPTFAFGRNVER